MAVRKPVKKDTKPARKVSQAFSAEEKAAMRQHVKEMQSGQDGETMVREKIATMQGLDRELAQQLHKLMQAKAPHLLPKLWYGMPAYARKDGKLVCWFQDAHKFKSRYATLGFSDKANLDEGAVWPVVYAVTEWSPTVEAKIAALVKKAES